MTRTNPHRGIFSTASVMTLAIAGMCCPAAAAAQVASSPDPVQQTTPEGAPDSTASSGADGQRGARDAALESTQPEIVVTGFRSSINKALALKKNETGVVDTILAEDIGKFPDSNLAESMQRVPGVALSRSDGGEGKNISVRGLGAGFTRVRLNGMEGTSQTGSSDIYGAGNRGRSFDFNVFASELFSSLSVRKTMSADTEEGSLGATVDLQTARPLDYKQNFVAAVTAQGSYNDLSRKLNPRLSALVSKQFADGTFGVLGSIAWTHRNTREEGYSAVNILRATDDGGFCSPLGFVPQNPVTTPAKGTDAANCATGVPRTGNAAAYTAISKPNVFLPRIPRYVRSDQDYDRVGATAAIQWEPSADTKLSLDGLYSSFNVTRRDNYIAGLSFGRNAGANGKPNSSVLDVSVTPDGTAEYGLFNGVDVRSEGLLEKYTSTFKQLTLSGTQKFGDAFQLDGLVGFGRSVFNDPTRTTVSLDAVNVNGFSYDFRDNGHIPTIKFGVDVADPTSFAFAPSSPDGTVRGLIGTRFLRTVTDNKTAELNALYSVNRFLKLRFGAQYRESDFTSISRNRTSANAALVPALPAGTTIADVSRSISGFGRGLSGNVPSSWVAADYEKFNDIFHISDATGIFTQVGPDGGYVADNGEVREQVSGGYAQLELDGSNLAIPLRGNIGVRYVHTAQHTVGYVPQGNASTVITNNREYDDWLPSVNLTAEFTPELLLRFAASKVMSRPDLNQVTPGLSAFNPTLRTISGGNPNLDPIRANTADVSLEYYFGKGGLLSVGGFYKDIKTYIQSLQETTPFNTTGLPDSILAGTTSNPTDLFTVTRFANTPGGKLKGIEVNYQQPLTFLPGFLKNLGVLANFTHVTSKITYFLSGSSSTVTTNDLIGLSKNAYSGTLYYEDKKLSLRGTASYRGSYLRAVPSGGPDSDVLGNDPTFVVDASASYQLNGAVRITLEAQNLTDEHNSLYIDSVRHDPLYDVHNGRTITIGASFKY